jgi:hypothetical protein
MIDMKNLVNRAIMALTRKVGETNQKIEKMQEEADQLSNKTIHTVNQLAKWVADGMERFTKMSDHVDNQVLCVKASQERLQNNIKLLKDSQAANTDEWVDKIYTTKDRLNTICDELQEDVNVLYKKMNAPSRPTAANTPYVASTSSPMDVRNHSSPTPQIHCDTLLAPQSYAIPDPVRTHVPVDHRTFDFLCTNLNTMPQDAPTSGTPRALERLIGGLLEDVVHWHGRGDRGHAVGGCKMLTKDNLMLVGVLREYYNTKLKSHDQLLENDHLWNGPDTCGALKHPAWDPLLDTSPEGWMEFYKSLRRNCI